MFVDQFDFKYATRSATSWAVMASWAPLHISERAERFLGSDFAAGDDLGDAAHAHDDEGIAVLDQEAVNGLAVLGF